MRINAITARNFLGARNIDIRISKPVSMFVGANGAGKSSLQEAIRMALTGETVRVGLKKEFERLVSEGEKTAEIAVSTQDQGTYSMILPSGKGTPMPEPGAMPYVLDAQRFASLEKNERRAFLFGLMGLSADGNDTVKRLLDRGCDQEKIEFIRPLLRIGFEAAREEAGNKAREAKGAWRAITGETYGSKKAEEWKAESPAIDQGSEEDSKAQLLRLEKELEDAIAHQSSLAARRELAQNNELKLADLREKSARIRLITDALKVDEVGLAEWEAKVAATRKAAEGDARFGLMHDLARSLSEILSIIMPFGEMNDFQRQILRNANATMDTYEEAHGKVSAGQSVADAEAKARLPEYERSLAVYRNAVENGKRNLAAAEAASEALLSIQEAQVQPPSDGEMNAATAQVVFARKNRAAAEAAASVLMTLRKRADAAKEKTTKAAEHHAEVVKWLAIHDALAPDGIPGDILSAALKPMNERLSASALRSRWPVVTISDGMEIGYGGRAYALLSESEKWRADAMIAEAIAHISGTRLLVLDRFDVLDLAGREDLILWLAALAARNEIDTALVFGTMKSLPGKLPDHVEAHWISDGMAGGAKIKSLEAVAA